MLLTGTAVDLASLQEGSLDQKLDMMRFCGFE